MKRAVYTPEVIAAFRAIGKPLRTRLHAAQREKSHRKQPRCSSFVPGGKRWAAQYLKMLKVYNANRSEHAA